MASNQRVAVVTGSSSGNGYETSLILARNGLLTYATMRNLVKGEKLKSVAEKEKLPLKIVMLDVTLYSMPPWFTGIALLGMFIGGLVPAAIMAISQANLLARNIIKEIRPHTSATSEIRITKISSTVFKFIALG